MPALHGFVSRVFFCTAWHCTWQAKSPHCTELHGPASKATMHGLARTTCKWIPSFTDLHRTAWKHMDPNLSLLMELNSYESQSVTAYGAPSRHCQIMGHGFHGTTLPMASIEPPLHGLARTPPGTRLYGPAHIRRCTDLHGKHATGLLNAWHCTDSMQLPCHFHVVARHCTAPS